VSSHRLKLLQPCRALCGNDFNDTVGMARVLENRCDMMVHQKIYDFLLVRTAGQRSSTGTLALCNPMSSGFNP
jgi:hypothetical protein